MSLLNDMLRDLARQQPNELLQDESNASLYQTKDSQKKIAFWFSSMLIFILVFFLALAIKHFFIRMSDKNNTTVPATSIAGTKEIHTVNDSYTPSVAVVNETNAPPPKSNSDYSSTQLQFQIDELLLKANQAIAIDRLTSPIEDNAYYYYKKILVLDPNQAQAQQGLESIARHYLSKAKEQIQLGNRSQANDFIQRAIFVDSDFAQAQIAADHLETDTSENLANVPHLSADTVEPVNESQKNKPAIPNEQKTVQKESIKPFVVAEAQSISVVPNAASKDEQTMQQAQQMLSQGKINEATILLKNFVAGETNPVQSAALLADIYLQQGNVQAAEVLLEQATYLTVVDKAKIKARLLSLQGKDAEAIVILEQQLSAADKNENYRALLASLYHKTGNYQLSIVNYQRLLSSFGDKPTYWLGLALAFDGLSQYKSALQAYTRLREFPQLQDQVKTYTDQRIAALRSE